MELNWRVAIYIGAGSRGSHRVIALSCGDTCETSLEKLRGMISKKE